MTLELGTVAPVGFEDFADPAWLGCMKKLGCTTAQAYRNRNGNDSAHDGPVSVEQISDYLAAAEMPCDSLHGFYGNDIDPSDPSESERSAAVDILRNEGEIARSLGGPLVVVHCSGIYKPAPGEDELEIRRRQLKKSIEELAAFGDDIGVTYAFENLPPYHAIGSDIAELTDLITAVNLPHVGICFDVAHANLAGHPFSGIDIAGPQIRYMHLCDNHGESDDHLMPTLGNIPWDDVAAAIARNGYDGVLMLEIFHSLDELMQLIDQGMAETLAAFLNHAKGQ